MAADARLGLAVSGGADSLALLLLAHDAMPARIAVGSVDHGLRPEAAAECALVADLCARLGIPHETLRIAPVAGGNLQARARDGRYRALGEWAMRTGCAAIATAHHADDQAETILMRLARGSATRGLAAIRPVADVPGHRGLPLIRPLLSWRSNELRAVVRSAGIAPVEDPSNEDERFLRVRVRKWLRDAPVGIEPERLARSARFLAEDAAALNWAADRQIETRVSWGQDTATYRPIAPHAIRLRIVAIIVEQLSSEGDARGDKLAHLVDELEAGRTATLRGVRCEPGEDGWHFTKAPPRRDYNSP